MQAPKDTRDLSRSSQGGTILSERPATVTPGHSAALLRLVLNGDTTISRTGKALHHTPTGNWHGQLVVNSGLVLQMTFAASMSRDVCGAASLAFSSHTFAREID